MKKLIISFISFLIISSCSFNAAKNQETIQKNNIDTSPTESISEVDNKISF